MNQVVTKAQTLFKIVCLFLSLVISYGSHGQSLTQENLTVILGEIDKGVLERVQKLLTVPEEHVDFAQAKLTIDQIVDPSINIFKETMRLHLMVDEVLAMGPFVSSAEKKDALRKYIYESGGWNQYKPFSYDLSDPKGTNVKNKLLTNYMDSRKGNCISMPFLFVTLGQKLELDMVASTAPLHIFVKFTDDENGTTQNLETTSGGHPARDSWIRQGFPMTDWAVQNGTYLAKLTKQETVASMTTVLLDHYADKEQFGQVVFLANLILQTYPKSINAVMHKSSAFNELLKVHGLWGYHSTHEVPLEKRELFRYLVSNVNGYHNEMLKMGWKQPSRAEEEAYDRRVRQAVIN